MCGDFLVRLVWIRMRLRERESRRRRRRRRLCPRRHCPRSTRKRFARMWNIFPAMSWRGGQRAARRRHGRWLNRETICIVWAEAGRRRAPGHDLQIHGDGRDLTDRSFVAGRGGLSSRIGGPGQEVCAEGWNPGAANGSNRRFGSYKTGQKC